MRRTWKVMVPYLLVALFWFAGQAKAETFIPKTTKQTDKTKKTDKKKKKKPPKQGWIPSIKVAFNFAMAQSQGVIGVPDGTTVALGLQLNSGLIFRHANHEWKSQLAIIETQTKVPGIDPFIKSADKLDFESNYIYSLTKVKWLGFYGGLSLTTPLFSSKLIKDKDTALDLNGDGTADATAMGQKPYRLTKAVSPFMFKQFAGMTMNPLRKKWMNLAFKVGTGAIEVWTRNGFVVDDNTDTKDLLELKRLFDYVEGGVEFQLAGNGNLADKLLSYGFKANVMIPYATNADTDLKGGQLTNVEFTFNLGINLAKWAALNYSLSVMRYPLIVEKWQVTNNLMLSITAAVGE